jgi:sec-independent protein translocase protein TatC
VSGLNRLLERIARLRRWIFVAIAAFLMLLVPGWLLSEGVLHAFQSLLGGERLYQTYVGEVFFSRMLVAAACAALALMPFLAYAVLNRLKIRGAVGYCLGGALLFGCGAVLAWRALLPVGVRFLLSIGSDALVMHLTQMSFAALCLGFVASVGLVFELPVVLWVLHGAGLMRVGALRRARGKVFLITTAVMAILTPTQDAVTLIAAVLPVLALYEGSILALTVAERRRPHEPSA